MPDPLDPQMQPVPWVYSIQPSGQSLATFPGDVAIRGATLSRFDPISYGADASGVADSSAAIAAADAAALAVGGQVTLSAPGNYRIAASLAIASPVVVIPGAAFTIATGQTLTFNGGFSAAPTDQVFNNATAGQGTIAFNPSPIAAYPEWWGGFGTNTGAQPDAGPGLQACINAAAVTQLGGETYYHSATISVPSSRTVKGLQRFWLANPGNMASRTCLMSGTLDAWFIGSATQPGGGVNAFVQGVNLRDFWLTRTIAPNAPASGYAGPAGIRFQFATSCFVDNLQLAEHCNDVIMTGAVGIHVSNCYNQRTVASPVNPGNDIYCSYNIDESANIGLAAGCASIYLDKNIINGSQTITSYGFFFPNGFTDVYLRHNETSFCNHAVYCLQPAAGSSTNEQDFHIINNIFDSCRGDPILITGSANYRAVITIQANYLAFGALGGGFGMINLTGLSGVISITANQMLGDGSTTFGTGLLITSCNGVITQGNMISDVVANQIYVNGCVSCSFSDIINHSTTVTGNAGCTVIGSSYCKFNNVFRGGAASLGSGYSIDSASNNIEVNTTGLIPGVLNGGAARKVIYNGTPVVLSGFATTFGTGNWAWGSST